MGVYQLTRAWAGKSETVKGWRRRRYDLFVGLCDLKPDEKILDVGAGSGAALERFNLTNPIVAIDLSPKADGTWLANENVTVHTADATAMPFTDYEFPVVFSNSVIEHVPAHLQAAFAAEVRRVGQRYFVQTPNRYFPIEPHYQFPFFQFLPKRVQQWLNAHFSLGWRKKGEWEDVRLLSARELQRLFPDARIEREKLFGLTKSLMAVRR